MSVWINNQRLGRMLFAMPPGSFLLPAVSRQPGEYYSETEQSIYIPVNPHQDSGHYQPQTHVVLVANGNSPRPAQRRPSPLKGLSNCTTWNSTYLFQFWLIQFFFKYYFYKFNTFFSMLISCILFISSLINSIH